MKINFDYKNVSPDEIKSVIEFYYQTKKDSLGTDGKPLEFGKVNVYISLNNQTDGEPLESYRDGEVIQWTVKKRPLQKTNKILIGEVEDAESPEDRIYVYRGKSVQNKRW